MAKRGPKGPLTEEHKAAMAAGRREGRIVRQYLEAVRMRQRHGASATSPEQLEDRLALIDAAITDADVLAELRLRQERADVLKRLDDLKSVQDIDALSRDFVEVAASYAARHGISTEAWTDFGVDREVLTQAGL